MEPYLLYINDVKKYNIFCQMNEIYMEVNKLKAKLAFYENKKVDDPVHHKFEEVINEKICGYEALFSAYEKKLVK